MKAIPDRSRSAGRLRRSSHSGADSRAELVTRSRVEDLVSDRAAGFSQVPDDQLDSEIEKALRRIAEHLGLDQGLLVQGVRDEAPPLPTHSWTVPGDSPAPATPGNEVLPWTHRQATAAKIVMFSRLVDLPREARRDREVYRLSGRRAHFDSR